MVFTEAVALINEAENNFDLVDKKVSVFSENSYRNFLINSKEAELYVIQESGTDSDYNYLCEAALGELKEKLGKSIKKIYSALKQFILNVIDKVQSTLFNKKVEEAHDKIKKTVEANPELKNKKIEIPNVEEEQKCIQEAIDKENGLIAKFKSGHYKKEDIDEIEKINEQCEKRCKQIAVVSVSILAAIGLYAKFGKGLSSNGSGIAKEKLQYADDDDFEINELDDDEVIHAVYSAKSKLPRLVKKSVSSIVNSMVKINIGLNKALAHKTVSRQLEPTKNIPAAHEEDMAESCSPDVYSENLYNEIFTENNNAKENTNMFDDMEFTQEQVNEAWEYLNDFITEDFDDIEDEGYMMEGVNIDVVKAYKATIKNYSAEIKNAKKALKAKDYDKARDHVASAKDIATKMKKDIKSIENDSLDSATIGFIIVALANALRSVAYIMITLPLGGIGGVVAQVMTIKEGIEVVVETLNNVADKIKKNEKITADDCNLFKTSTLVGVNKLIKATDNMSKLIDKKEEADEKNVKESAGLDEEYAEAYLESMEEELFGTDAETYLESMEAELFDDEDISYEESVQINEIDDDINAILESDDEFDPMDILNEIEESYTE